MEKRLIIILLMPFLLFWHWFEPAAKKNRDGIKAFQGEKYQEALEQFLSARGIKPGLPELKSNTAASLYQMKKYQEALEEFSKIDPEKAHIPKADFYYNVGNSFFRLNKFDKALKSYKKSLVLNSRDMNAKKNFELTLKKMEEQKKKQKQDKNKDKDKKKDKQKDQQKQQQKKEKKHQNVMQYLNQNEKKQMKKKKRKIGIARKEKDW